MIAFLSQHWLDILGTLVGLVYIYQEYKASIWLWVTGIVMPVIYMFVYLDAGLYADFGMQVYYALAAIYGLVIWKWGKQKNQEQTPIAISHIRLSVCIQSAIFFLVAWAALYLILIHCTNSNVPVLDSFGNALSFVGLWWLARKYIEQWWIWIVVDIELAALYVYKDIPFTAGLYAVYVVIACLGYRKWRTMMQAQSSNANV